MCFRRGALLASADSPAAECAPGGDYQEEVGEVSVESRFLVFSGTLIGNARPVRGEFGNCTDPILPSHPTLQRTRGFGAAVSFEAIWTEATKSGRCALLTDSPKRPFAT